MQQTHTLCSHAHLHPDSAYDSSNAQRFEKLLLLPVLSLVKLNLNFFIHKMEKLYFSQWVLCVRCFLVLRFMFSRHSETEDLFFLNDKLYLLLAYCICDLELQSYTLHLEFNIDSADQLLVGIPLVILGH